MKATACERGHALVGENVKRNGKTGKICCRTCAKARARAFGKRHKAEISAKNKAWRQTPEGQRATRHADYMKHYGITLEQYEDMLANQEGVCAISGQSPSETRLHVDHDHATNQIRQLLHSDINTAIGLFQENPEWLRKAADYIERWKRAQEDK